jgi:hypothetical protein
MRWTLEKMRSYLDNLNLISHISLGSMAEIKMAEVLMTPDQFCLNCGEATWRTESQKAKAL